MSEVLTSDTESRSADGITYYPSLSGTGEANAAGCFEGSIVLRCVNANASGAWIYVPSGLATVGGATFEDMTTDSGFTVNVDNEGGSDAGSTATGSTRARSRRPATPRPRPSMPLSTTVAQWPLQAARSTFEPGRRNSNASIISDYRPISSFRRAGERQAAR